jgi:hypothetical protein
MDVLLQERQRTPAPGAGGRSALSIRNGHRLRLRDLPDGTTLTIDPTDMARHQALSAALRTQWGRTMAIR